MAPHTLDTILQPPQWPASLTQFVTSCLAWDPKARPTCAQAMSHEYFSDAFDPLRPKSSGNKLLGRKHSSVYDPATPDTNQTLSSKTSSWFRRSLIARESAPVVPQAQQHERPTADHTMSPTKQNVHYDAAKSAEKSRPAPSKRNTWTNGAHNNGAPMPILPSIRPISPLSNAVTAQAHGGPQSIQQPPYQGNSQHASNQQKPPKKLGRQLSQASQGNHYADTHRQEAEKALNGQSGLASPTSGQKESFFSHLRKRARRLSGRHQLPMSPKEDDVEANAGCGPWANPRNSITDAQANMTSSSGFMDLDNALQNVRYSMENSPHAHGPAQSTPVKPAQRSASNPSLKRHHSLPHAQGNGTPSSSSGGLHPSRSTRRVAQRPNLASNQYDAPDEQEELLDEALNSAQAAVMHFDRQQPSQPRGSHEYVQSNSIARPRAVQVAGESVLPAPYPTPSPSAKRNSVVFGAADQNAQGPQAAQPIDIHQAKQPYQGTAFPFPTPPDENEWAAAAAASLGLGEQWRR